MISSFKSLILHKIEQQQYQIMNVKKREGESGAAYFVRNLGMAAAACMWAEVVTIPIDTAKVRM